MKCPHCGQEHPDDTKFCPQTGKRLELIQFTCDNPKCDFRQPLPLSAKFCPNCGHVLSISNIDHIIQDSIIDRTQKRDDSYMNISEASEISLSDELIEFRKKNPNLSHIAIFCNEKDGRFCIGADEYINLHYGYNILDLKTFPWLEGGFCLSDGFGHHVWTDDNDFILCNWDTMIEEVDISKFDSSKITSFTGAFQGLHCITELEIRSLSKAKIKTAGYMFCGCDNLRYIDGFNCLNFNFNTDFHHMFDGCISLKTLELAGISTCHGMTFEAMFRDCHEIENLNFDDFSTKSVDGHKGSVYARALRSMFENCYNLKTLNLSRFDTVNSFVYDRMFKNCQSMLSLNISNWNLSNAKSYKELFYGCKSLKQIKAYGCNRTTLQLVRKALNEATLWGVKIETDNIMFKIFG